MYLSTGFYWGCLSATVVVAAGLIALPPADRTGLYWLGLWVAAVPVAQAWYSQRTLHGWANDFTEAMRLITLGGYGHKLYGQQTAVATSVRAFNTMSERLAQQFTQLEDERQQLRAILGGMIEGVVFIDAHQRILFANERAAELLEFHPHLAVGRRLWELVRQRAILELVARALDASEPCRAEIDGRGIGRCLMVYVARLPGTSAQGAILVLHDFTELRRLEKVRQEFVANVSHELKTPLAVIKACTEALIGGAVESPKHRGPFLEQIDDQANRLHSLILDLLSLARIESGELTIELQPVPLLYAVNDCVERQRARSEAKNQRIVILTEKSDRNLCALADEEAIDTILDNLVDNAIKYTPEGGSIWLKWQKSGPDHIVMEVEDTGIGIPERDMPRIFERFYRVDKARSREVGGTGLGLSIVKHLVQSLKGSLAARSSVGKGTTFTVRLPMADCSDVLLDDPQNALAGPG